MTDFTRKGSKEDKICANYIYCEMKKKCEYNSLIKIRNFVIELFLTSTYKSAHNMHVHSLSGVSFTLLSKVVPSVECT